MTTLEALAWQSVPEQVERLADQAAEGYGRVKVALGDHPFGAWLDAESGRVVVESGGAQTILKAAGVECTVRTEPFGPDEAWVPVKSAEFKFPFQISNLSPSKLNAPFGGATPMAATLTGGLLGAGLGYAGGAIAENMLPAESVRRGKLRRVTAMLGGMAGAGPGMWLASESVRNRDPGTSAVGSLVRPNNLFGHPERDPIDTQGFPAIKDAGAALREVIPDEFIADDMLKFAFGEGGGLFLPSIQVDAFNRLVLSDPYASPQLQAGAVGIVSSADSARGGFGLISPFDIARIGLGMGAGLSQAYLGGKVLGAVAGLTPGAQKQLQQAGLVAGALKAVVPALFGR
jgi:hypothetical protein